MAGFGNSVDELKVLKLYAQRSQEFYNVELPDLSNYSIPQSIQKLTRLGGTSEYYYNSPLEFYNPSSIKSDLEPAFYNKPSKRIVKDEYRKKALSHIDYVEKVLRRKPLNHDNERGRPKENDDAQVDSDSDSDSYDNEPHLAFAFPDSVGRGQSRVRRLAPSRTSKSVEPLVGRIRRPGLGKDGWKYIVGANRFPVQLDPSTVYLTKRINVITFIAKCLNIEEACLRSTPLSPEQMLRLKDIMRGRNIATSLKFYHHFKRRKASQITDCPVNDLSFHHEEKGNISVVDYFLGLGIELEYKFLPALLYGTDARPIYLPMEIFELTKKQRDPTIIERPTVNLVQARILSHPMLKYHETGDVSFVDPKRGQWNMEKKKMVNGGRVDYWTCVNFAECVSDSKLQNFCEKLAKMCRMRGMLFSEKYLCCRRGHHDYIEDFLVSAYDESIAKLKKLKVQTITEQLQLLIVILPEKHLIEEDAYGIIKRVCDTRLGVVSQCIEPNNVIERTKAVDKRFKLGLSPLPEITYTNTDRQFFSSVALKINMKVGGINCVLVEAVEKNMPFLTKYNKSTLVLGAYVTQSPHPIAAVVGSIDWPEVTKYRGWVSGQKHKEVIIQDLEEIIRQHLRVFYDSNKKGPDRIIFYRKGLSVWQINKIVGGELTAIREGCKEFPELKPRITYIVVQNRRHSCLKPLKVGQDIYPGTVVDDIEICHPSEFDFFLCSHPGKLKENRRPIHYHVVYDENEFLADEIQTLTNNLCYTYASSTTALSIVPPIRYAKLLAYRARYYVGEKMNIEQRRSKVRFTDGVSVYPTFTRMVNLLPIKENIQDKMFYC